MKTFENVKGLNFTFTSCEVCDARCCDGRRGSIFAGILLEEFAEVAPHFPILFIMGETGFLKPVILLSNGEDFCPYLRDFKCTIYNRRPSVCRAYPLSAGSDNELYLDTSCPAVHKGGEVAGAQAQPEILRQLYHGIPTGYQEKYRQTSQHLQQFRSPSNLEIVAVIREVTFLALKSDFGDGALAMHRGSLKNLNTAYFRNVASVEEGA